MFNVKYKSLKKYSKKRTNFRKQANNNYYIKNNRLYNRYRNNNIEIINFKNSFQEEIIPLIKYIHITHNHCGYKVLCNHIIKNNYYWEGYSSTVKDFCAKCELCNKQKKIFLNNTPENIIKDNRPKYKYIVDIYIIYQNI